MIDNLKAFLDTIAISELGAALIAATDDGYDVLVGSTLAHPLTFHSYDTHPNILNHQFDSTAAGRYQIIHPTYISLARKLNLSNFDPDTQDKMCIELITQKGALEDVVAGRFDSAAAKCRNVWASLPGGDSGQHENALSTLEQDFVNAGGTIVNDGTST